MLNINSRKKTNSTQNKLCQVVKKNFQIKTCAHIYNNIHEQLLEFRVESLMHFFYYFIYFWFEFFFVIFFVLYLEISWGCKKTSILFLLFVDVIIWQSL